MNEPSLIDHVGERAYTDEMRLSSVALDVAMAYTFAEALEIINDHIFDHGDESPIMQYLAEFAIGSAQERDDAIVYLRVAINDVIEAQSRLDAQKMINDGMVGFNEPDGDA